MTNEVPFPWLAVASHIHCVAVSDGLDNGQTKARTPHHAS